MDNFSLFKLGNIYTYKDKNSCYEQSLIAIKFGYHVRYGTSFSGHYFFEIIDPFETGESE